MVIYFFHLYKQSYYALEAFPSGPAPILGLAGIPRDRVGSY